MGGDDGAYHRRILEGFDKGDQQKKGRQDINLATGKFFTAFSFLFRVVMSFLGAIYVVQARTTITGSNDVNSVVWALNVCFIIIIIIIVCCLFITYYFC